MNFDEAIKYAKEYSFVQSYEYEYDYNLVTDLEDVVELLEKLEEEYAPTVEMTNEDKNTLYYYLENSTFFSLIERKHAIIEAEMLGITEGINEFLDLSDEDLMQAWLNPETIVVTDSE